MIRDRDFKEVLYRYLEHRSTAEELMALAEWSKRNPVLLEEFLEEYWDSLSGQPEMESSELVKDILLSAKEIEATDSDNEGIEHPEYERSAYPINRRRRKWLEIAAAAIFVIASSSAIWYWVSNQHTFQKEAAHEEVLPDNDRLPGGNKAVLTLADGSTVVLDSASNGEISRQGNVTVIKLGDGELSYRGKGVAGTNAVVYNTITTPRGGQYQIVLADGTKVWLNAESSLKFPTTFTTTDRKVELSGEGYFEVTHQANHPFYVTTNGMEVKVLGTHFNVKAYSDESEIQTTLLEGRVEVRAGQGEVALSPGQQARLHGEDKKLEKLKGVDISRIMAWKNGEFIFDETELKDALKILSRWYDFRAVYSGNPEPTYVYGSIPRSKNLSEVLKILEVGGIRFRLEQQGGTSELVVLK